MTAVELHHLYKDRQRNTELRKHKKHKFRAGIVPKAAVKLLSITALVYSSYSENFLGKNILTVQSSSSAKKGACFIKPLPR